MNNTTRKPQEDGALEDSDAEMARLLQEKHIFEVKRDQLTAQLYDTDRKIVDIQSKYGAIYNKRAQLLRLPNEVTCMIFDYALLLAAHMTAEEPVHNTARRPLNVELIISHVCRQWRSVALSYQQLWAHFRYVFLDSLRAPSFERFEAYLERSRSAGLELWFNFYEARAEVKSLLSLLQMAIPHVARWKRFTLWVDFDTPLLPAIKAILDESTSAPMLEHFSIFAAADTVTSDLDVLVPRSFKQGAPKLMSVLFDLPGAFACFPPFDHITTFRLEELELQPPCLLSWHVFLDILALPSLINLSIVGHVFSASASDYGAIQLITFSNLKHLRIANNNQLLALLPFIRAPLLESLTVKDVEFEEDFAPMPVGSDEPEPEPYVFPSLQSLCFIAVEAETRPAYYFAKMTANATEVTFSNGHYEESFFCAVADPLRAEETIELWPKLQVLTFNIETDRLDELLDLAMHRPKRKSIILRFFDDVDEMLKVSDLASFVSYAQLARAYKIETIDSKRNWLRQVRWPPASGGYNPGLFLDDDDPFSIDEYDEE